MTERNDFPFEINDLETIVGEELMKYYQTFPDGFVRVGPQGYFVPKRFKLEGPMIYNMEVRPSDIFVLTHPRSGTTWTQELVWLIGNDLDYARAKTVPLNERFPCLESSLCIDKKFYTKLINETEDEDTKKALLSVTEEPSCNKVFTAASPRFIKSHLPISLLPPTMLDTAKVIYVARDPRDVAVSFYHILFHMDGTGYQMILKLVGNIFELVSVTHWGPYFPHVKEAWVKRNHPNMLFLFYEELSKDLTSVVKRVADFLGKSLNEEQIAELCQHLRFENFKKNNAVNGGYLKVFSNAEHKNISQFIRNERSGQTDKDNGFVFRDNRNIYYSLNKTVGKSGEWRSHFDEEMTREAEEWMSENMRDTDLRFPHNI